MPPAFAFASQLKPQILSTPSLGCLTAALRTSAYPNGATIELGLFADFAKSADSSEGDQHGEGSPNRVGNRFRHGGKFPNCIDL
jgi:hypothetical protein